MNYPSMARRDFKKFRKQIITLLQMKKELKKAEGAWRKLKPKALEKRDEFLSKLAIDKSSIRIVVS